MQTISEQPSMTVSIGINPLPEDQSQWPRAAEKARDLLFRELNRWSRDNDWPTTMNSWIAEEAVRRGF